VNLELVKAAIYGLTVAPPSVSAPHAAGWNNAIARLITHLRAALPRAKSLDEIEAGLKKLPTLDHADDASDAYREGASNAASHFKMTALGVVARARGTPGAFADPPPAVVSPAELDALRKDRDDLKGQVETLTKAAADAKAAHAGEIDARDKDETELHNLLDEQDRQIADLKAQLAAATAGTAGKTPATTAPGAPAATGTTADSSHTPIVDAGAAPAPTPGAPTP